MAAGNFVLLEQIGHQSDGSDCAGLGQGIEEQLLSLGGFGADLLALGTVVGILDLLGGSPAEGVHQFGEVLRDQNLVVASQSLADGAHDGVDVLGVQLFEAQGAGVEEQVAALELSWRR